jgi:phosphatidylethanolamine/phosphatidyl-N-methylethanolamine N-methyltransferase
VDIDTVKKTYRRYSRRYDLYFGVLYEQGRRRVIEKMACTPGEKILDVGVGTGLSLPLYPEHARIHGIDLSQDMLERARSRKRAEDLRNVVSLEEMDAAEMSFEDGSFDKVVAMYVISVVPDPVGVAREMCRVCREDGEIYIVNHFHHSHPVLKAMERLLAPFSGRLGFRPHYPLEEFLESTGLIAVENQPVNLLGYWTMLRIMNHSDGRSN